jgi:hypothetical protein
MSDTQTVAPVASATMVSLSPEQKAKLDAIQKKAEAGRKTIEEIKGGKNGDLVVDGTLKYNEEHRKQQVSIRCSISGCNETREVFTSDIHQIRVCMSHRKEQKKASRAAKAAEKKELIALGKKAKA